MEVSYRLAAPNAPHRLRTPKEPISNGLGRFRIQPTASHSAPRQALARASSSNSKSEEIHYTRRSHRKSRNGCQACKARRVKCDELKPLCSRCNANNRQCLYDESKSPSINVVSDSTSSSSSSSPSPQPPVRWSIGSATDLRISMVLEKAQAIHGLPPCNSRIMTPNVELLRHFPRAATTSFAFREAQIHVETFMLPTAFVQPSLMHGALAIAATHLMHLQPDNQAHRISRIYHTQRAAALFHKELCGKIGLDNMDYIVANTLIMKLVPFVYEDGNPEDSWVFQQDPESMEEAMTWLTIQSGLGSVFESIEPFLADSIWRGLFLEVNGDENCLPKKSLKVIQPGDDGLPRPLVQLCNITPESNNSNNPYHLALRQLNGMFNLPFPGNENFGTLVSFSTLLPAEFRDLMRQRDERALLLTAYWLSMVSHLDLWWIQGRVKNECIAICKYLEPSQDPRIRRLLKYPARVFGYQLSPEIEQDVSCAETEDLVLRLSSLRNRKRAGNWNVFPAIF